MDLPDLGEVKEFRLSCPESVCSLHSHLIPKVSPHDVTLVCLHRLLPNGPFLFLPSLPFFILSFLRLTLLPSFPLSTLILPPVLPWAVYSWKKLLLPQPVPGVMYCSSWGMLVGDSSSQRLYALLRH